MRSCFRRPTRRLFFAAALLAVCSLLALPSCGPEVGRTGWLTDGQWFKGNTHVHSRWSDGRDWPETVAQWYKEHGYHFLVVTDHNTLQQGERWVSEGDAARFEAYRARFGDDWVETRLTTDAKTGQPVRQVRAKGLEEYRGRFEEPDRFLLVMGEEITGKHGKVHVHANALNLAEAVPPHEGETFEATIAADVAAVRTQEEAIGRPILVHLNHPNWGGVVPVEQIWPVADLHFFEVMNSVPTNVFTRGSDTTLSTDRLWDVMLAKRLGDLRLGPIYGIAADDSHNLEGGSGTGWIMVRAAELAPGPLVQAMRRGDFYATTGVLLKDLRWDGKRLTVAVEADRDLAYRIQFIGTLPGYDRSREDARDDKGNLLPPTQRYSPDIGKVLKEVEGTRAEYVCTGSELYVRARVVSSRVVPYTGKEKDQDLPPVYETAWTQPVVPGAK
ncbi:MAG: hypothetical protein ISS74_02715 [Planctomycetes bacterium]|nr:hypothetical protein [Planctomycetota bacterium]